MKTLFNVLLLVVLACCHSHQNREHDHNHEHDHDHEQDHGPDAVPPVVKTAWAEFRGGYNVTRLGRRFETYRGIRYAETSVGELRSQNPVNASEDGPACALPAPPGYYVDEDCLTVNVYTPLKEDRKEPLPVIVFIPAGGFYSMTRSDLAGPHDLLDSDIVLVTINYRLGSLGSTGDELAPGNNGFKDQVAALKWIQRNIAAFGGDPASVSIAGFSAGSFSVMLHMISPMSKGLFHKGISMSGSPINIRPTRDIGQNNVNCVNCVNCANCVNCVNCVDCANCADCANCKNCQNCRNCVDCANCADCANCKNCQNCRNCQDCRNCQNCPNCLNCENCQNSHDCQNCQFCKNCHNCENCENCDNCHNCKNKQNCQNSHNCQNCQNRQNVN